jgi:hypothetical protein
MQYLSRAEIRGRQPLPNWGPDCEVPYDFTSRLGGVVVSVLATGPKGRVFKPGQSDGFLRAIKSRSTPSAAGVPMP